MKTNNRHPIITFIGHVNHGKTSLIEKLCQTNILKNEIGTITQYLTAYFTKTTHGYLTILDTPGHEVFWQMRERGIKCTDIIILVIAADDGIADQTRKILKNINKENTPVIVVINKIDKIDKTKKTIEKIKTELTKYNIIDENLGGNNLFVQTSVKLNLGINDLLETIYLQAELLDLKKYTDKPTEGIILDTQIVKGYGILLTIIIYSGTLKKQTYIKIGNNYEKIKLILDLNKKEISELHTAIPAYIVCSNYIAKPGETFYQIKQIKKIKLIKKKAKKIEKIQNNLTINNLNNEEKKFNIIIKAKTLGSAEAIENTLKNIQQNNIIINYIGTGNFYESDVKNAVIFNSTLIGLNITYSNVIKKKAEEHNITIKLYNTIYNLIDDIKNIFNKNKKLNENEQEINNILGTALIKSIFTLSNKIKVFGCTILSGLIKLSDPIMIKRNEKIILKTTIKNIQSFKIKIKKAKKGEECGIELVTNNTNEITTNDLIISYKKEILN